MSLNKVFSSLTIFVLMTACATTLPEEKHKVYRFPDSKIFVDEPTGDHLGRKYRTLGWVRTKANWPSMEQETVASPMLCKNYYNKAAADLIKEAEKVGADAVIRVRTVVVLLDGAVEEHKTAECSDDGSVGEILLKGVAIKYLKLKEKHSE